MKMNEVKRICTLSEQEIKVSASKPTKSLQYYQTNIQPRDSKSQKQGIIEAN
jgi:hypothetical protein